MQPSDTRPANRDIVIHAARLTREAFAPFGDVIENPQPGVHPSSIAKSSQPLPCNGVSANQGSAIKFQHVSRQLNLYDQAPSRRPGAAIMSIFRCAARARIPDLLPATAPIQTPAPIPAGTTDLEPLPSAFPVTILERHPFTTQTFIPFTANPNNRYLVIVAPSLPLSPPTPSSSNEKETTLPVPASSPPSSSYFRPLPGSGKPDLRRLRAFVATATQAVTYGAGTWHAPMVALGEKGTEAMDFVVVQFANGVALEDCQEVELTDIAGPGPRLGDGPGERRHVSVKLVPMGLRMAKL
ncbi:ureidoglycolate hydrolase [Parathielavia appendiculata]|uniref:Ureidoglycolate hydrolase n=1 Tax=Parathielavia appendiculata TaxID=2587402 RepID=A0AAN6U568_9PEZI|nr:ureidoglycolate hydrolase [Parathielavia appendiculata]